MNDNLRAELERLKERQAQLHHGVDLLGVHIRALEKRMAEEKGASGAQTARVAGALPSVPPVLPGVKSGNIQQPTPTSREQAVASVSPATLNQQPESHAQPLTAATFQHREHLPPSEGAREKARTRAATPPPVPPDAFKATAAAPVPARPESFEMRLGTYWLVRIGIVAMLTALVFFGTYAYQNYIGRLGPGGKVALLYLASGALLGFGAWFQRQAARESLRNYAQVLFAGGMAAVYFTTYAAHHFPNLQVIGSAALDGALLLGWAGFMAWMADRKKSEVFAMFAVGLAYYSSVITHVGHFTLYSNLVLSAAVLFFLVRNRWAKLSFASLVATYASYGFWRLYTPDGWQWAGPDAGLWTGVYFLVAYWVVFTAAVFLSRHKEFAGVNRASFITLNNAAFYAMFLLTMLQVRSAGFWKFNLIAGAVLLGAAVLAKLRLREEPLAANTYLSHGLLLVTVGLIAKFNQDHSTLALALCLESVVLWITGTMRRNIIMRTGACVSAALASLWALDGIEPDDARGVWLGAGVGGLLVFNALWSHWKGQGNSPRLMRAAPTYFSALALLIWSVAISQNVGLASRPAAYALFALVLVAAMHVSRLRELGLLGQSLLPVAAVLFIVNVQTLDQAQPWWVFASVAGVALGLVHWWQRQTAVETAEPGRQVGQVVMAVILAAVTGFWLEPLCDTQEWLLATGALVLALTAYGAVTRNGILALVGQVFVVLSVITFFTHAGTDALGWLAAASPVAALGILALGGGRWAEANATECSYAGQIRDLAVGYGRAAMALVVWWTFQYAETRELVWSFTALGAVAFAIAGWQKSRDFLVFATVLNLSGLCSLVFHLLSGTAVYWPNVVAVAAWMLEQQLARRQPERYPIPAVAHNAAMISAGVALWWLLSRWVLQGFSGIYLTASWSLYAFAVFAMGMALRERMYRWLGLGVLGAALARVVILDVWRLDTLYRILSFFALGLVLLVLGFIYNKYQERIRQWL